MGKELKSDNVIICSCFERSAAEIRDAAVRLGLTTFEELAAAILAGAGCTTCRPEVETILQELEGLREPVPSPPFPPEGAHVHEKPDPENQAARSTAESRSDR